MPYKIANLKIVKDSRVILGCQIVGFSAVVFADDDGIFGVMLDVIIVVAAAGALAAILLFDGFFNHDAVPGLAPFS